MAYTVGQMGPGVLLHLGRLLLTLYAALLAFGLVGLLPVALIAGVPIRRFLRAVAEPATIAFATSTSEAALPRAMEAMEALGVPRRIVALSSPRATASIWMVRRSILRWRRSSSPRPPV
jgi:proton glutamate symport protein